MIVFGEAHLRRILGAFAAYYNKVRVHRSLDKDAPFHRAVEHLGAIASRPFLGGLHLRLLKTSSLGGILVITGPNARGIIKFS
jgi:hypothetical protein